jgi:uncharacterized membrane protein YphA (DoxX/SURF4 family)
MKKLTVLARWFLGVVFVVFGANGLMMALVGHGFIPVPPPAQPEMLTIMSGFMAMKYLFPLVKILEILAGLLLLLNKYVNAAIVMLAPIVVNILGMHLFVDLSGAPIALAITFFLVVLIYDRWADFSPLVKK